MNEGALSPPAIVSRDLVLSYGERAALKGVSLEVAAGSTLGLLGPNGSGKSTLLAAVAGLRAPQLGDVRVLGAPPSPAVRRRIGVVFQESCLDPLMTVRETLWLHGRLFGLAAGQLRRRIEELLSQFSLDDRVREPVRALSGGLRRRLELARALLPWPDVLLLDEPTTGLDPDSRRAFWELVRGAGPGSLSEAGALTVLLATNDVLEAERECDRVAFLHRGRLVAQGTPEELKAGLKHDAVRLECADGRVERLAGAITGWPGVGRVARAGSVLHLTVDDAASFVPRLFQTDADGIRTIHVETATLEDAYFQITGASLSPPPEAPR